MGWAERLSQGGRAQLGEPPMGIRPPPSCLLSALASSVGRSPCPHRPCLTPRCPAKLPALPAPPAGLSPRSCLLSSASLLGFPLCTSGSPCLPITLLPLPWPPLSFFLGLCHLLSLLSLSVPQSLSEHHCRCLPVPVGSVPPALLLLVLTLIFSPPPAPGSLSWPAPLTPSLSLTLENPAGTSRSNVP